MGLCAVGAAVQCCPNETRTHRFIMTSIMAWPFYGSGVTAVLINTCEHSQMLAECSDCCWRQCLAVPKPGMAGSGLGTVPEGSLPLLDWP